MSSAPRPALVILALGLSTSLVPLGSTMIAVALPAIERDLGRQPGSITHAVVTSYLVVSTVCQGSAGKLGDRWGHLRTMALGQALFAAGAVGGLLSPGLAALAVSRVIMALGAALIGPSAMALIRGVLPEEQRARAFGSFGAILSLATAVGPLIGGELTARFGWHAIFVANLPLLLAARALAARVRWGEPAARRAQSGPGPSLMRFRGLVAGGLVVALHNMALYALLFQVPAFFSQLRGVPSDRVGRALLTMTLSMMLLSPVGGRFARPLGARVLALTGSFLAFAGIVWLADVRALVAPADAVLPLILLGAGLGLASAPANATAMNAVPSHRSGAAAGLVSTMRYLGGIAGIAASNALLRGATDDAALHRHRAAFFLSAGAVAAAAVVALFLPGKPPPASAPS